MKITPTKTCPECNGKRMTVNELRCDGDVEQIDVTFVADCPRCFGRGYVIDREAVS